MYRDSGTGNITIDLQSQDGNAFALIGYAQQLAKQMGKDPKRIANKMMEGDYSALVKYFEQTFPTIDLLNKPEEL